MGRFARVNHREILVPGQRLEVVVEIGEILKRQAMGFVGEWLAGGNMVALEKDSEHDLLLVVGVALLNSIKRIAHPWAESNHFWEDSQTLLAISSNAPSPATTSNAS